MEDLISVKTGLDTGKFDGEGNPKINLLQLIKMDNKLMFQLCKETSK